MLNQMDQAFNDSFWLSVNQSQANGGGWLNCAKYGENNYFVNILYSSNPNLNFEFYWKSLVLFDQ